MKNSIIMIAAFVSVFAGSIAAQQADIPTGCPSLRSQKPAPKKIIPRTSKQLEADKLAAEAQEVSRVPSRENLTKAISLADEALKCDPNNLTAYLVLARAHADSQRYMDVPRTIAGQRAWENLTKARAIDPDNIEVLLILADRIIFHNHDYMGGKYDWVLDHYAKYLESYPNVGLAHFYRGFAFSAKGQFQEALAEHKIATPSWKGDAGGVAALALAYAQAGQPEPAREILKELLGRDARGEHVVEYRIAAVYEVLGERNEAFRWLKKEVHDRDGINSWLLWLNHDPVWNRMRSDRRFKEIQKRAGWKN